MAHMPKWIVEFIEKRLYRDVAPRAGNIENREMLKDLNERLLGQGKKQREREQKSIRGKERDK